MDRFLGYLTAPISPTSGQLWEVKLRAYSLLYVVAEIYIVFRERRKAGLIALLSSPFRFAKYVICTLIVFAAFGRRAYIALLLFAWFRRVDDVIDGDTRLVQHWTLAAYRAQKRDLLGALSKAHLGVMLLREDLLVVRAFALARDIAQTIAVEVTHIWEVIEWESDRRDESRLVTRAELVTETAKLDTAILRVCVKMLGGDIERFDAIAQEFTGVFTRADWLDNMSTDLREKIVNIPADGVSQFGIDVERVYSCGSWSELMQYSPFAAWYQDEIRRTAREWTDLRLVLGDDFGGVFTSRIVSRLFMRITVGKMEPQFERAALRATRQE